MSRSSGTFTLVCNDGDGPDGTTWYHLIDPNGRPIADHAWPMPLEELARDLHGEVVRVSNLGHEGFGPSQSIGLPCAVPDYEHPDRGAEALDWLEKELAEGSLPVRVVEKRASDAGVSPARVKEASVALGVEKHRVWGKRTRLTNRNRGSFGVWCLPGRFDRDEALARAEAVGVELPKVLAVFETAGHPLAAEDVMPGEQDDDVLTSNDRRRIAEAIDVESRKLVRARAELEKDIERRVNGHNGNGRSPVMTDEKVFVDIDGETMEVGVDVTEVESEGYDKVEMCKIDGCPHRATGKASFSGLCDLHKSEEASRRNRQGHKNRKAEHPVEKLRKAHDKKGKAVPPSERIVVDDDTRALLGESNGKVTLTTLAAKIENLRRHRDDVDKQITEAVDQLVELARS